MGRYTHCDKYFLPSCPTSNLGIRRIVTILEMAHETSKYVVHMECSKQERDTTTRGRLIDINIMLL